MNDVNSGVDIVVEDFIVVILHGFEVGLLVGVQVENEHIVKLEKIKKEQKEINELYFKDHLKRVLPDEVPDFVFVNVLEDLAIRITD